MKLLFSQKARDCFCEQEDVPLGDPDILVCSVGTEIFYEAKEKAEADKKWGAILDQGWNRESVLSIVSKYPGLKLQVNLLHFTSSCYAASLQAG